MYETPETKGIVRLAWLAGTLAAVVFVAQVAIIVWAVTK